MTSRTTTTSCSRNAKASARSNGDSVVNQVTPSYGLHPFQRQVINDLLAVLIPLDESLVINGSRVVAHMPTGAGKTRVACHAACHLLNRAAADRKLIVWLASTEELCEQAADDLTRAWESLGNRPVAVHRYWGNARLDITNLSEGFLVAGLSKMWAASRNDRLMLITLAKMAAGVIFDEAHQAIAPTYRYITEYLLTYQPPLLGLSATPGRTAEPGEPDYELAEMFNFNKVSIDPKGHDSPVTYLVTQGFLADPHFEHIQIRSQVAIQDPQNGRDYTQSDLNKVGDDETWQKTIVEYTLRALRRHKRVIVFCPSVSSARKCADAVEAGGFDAATILGKTPTDTRRHSIDKFKNPSNEAMALFNYGVLTAGFDAPRTRCAIIARPTNSLVLYSQMVGRVLRGTRSGGNMTCSVQTVVDTNLPGFGSVIEAFRNWEQIWKQE